MDEEKLRYCRGDCKDWVIHVENLRGYECQRCLKNTKWSPNSLSGWSKKGSVQSTNIRPEAFDRKVRDIGKWAKRTGQD